MPLGYRPLAGAPLASRPPAVGGTAFTLTANVGNVTYQGISATLTKSGAPTAYVLTANVGAVTYQGLAASLLFNRKVVAAVGSVSYQGVAVTLSRGRNVTASAGGITYQGASASLLFNRKIVAAAGSITYQGIEASLTASAGVKTLTALPGSITLAGTAGTLLYKRSLVALPGTVVYQGATAFLRYSGIFEPEPSVGKGAGGVAGKARRRRRAFVRIDDQEFEVRSKGEALALLRKASQTAKEAARARASEIVQVTPAKGEKKPPATSAVPLLALPEIEVGGEEDWVQALQPQVESIARNLQEIYAQALTVELRRRVADLEDEVEALTLLLEDD